MSTLPIHIRTCLKNDNANTTAFAGIYTVFSKLYSEHIKIENCVYQSWVSMLEVFCNWKKEAADAVLLSQHQNIKFLTLVEFYIKISK